MLEAIVNDLLIKNRMPILLKIVEICPLFSKSSLDTVIIIPNSPNLLLLNSTELLCVNFNSDFDL